MAGVLGLGDGGGSALNQDVIDKLKAADRVVLVEPIEKNIETWDEELVVITDIESKVNEFLVAVKQFDLYNSTSNAFEQMTASTTGSAALFDAVDVSELTAGTVTATFTQLASRDVYQSDAVTEAVKDTVLNAGTLTIQAGSSTAIDIDTTSMTYQDIVDNINLQTGMIASVENVGTDSYRLVIKSSDSGTDNALTITGAASQTLGYTTDGTTKNAANQTLTAQNMQGTIDGIDYDVASNTNTVQGNLTITAIELGTSTISIQSDTSAVITQVDAMLTLYNELVDLVDAELLSADSSVNDASSLRSMMSQIKDYLFADYGASADKNIFQYGIELDKTGHLSINTTDFATALSDNYDDLIALFVGTAEDEGLGTQLKTFVDALDGYDGLLYNYGETMADRKTGLDEDLEEAIADLDAKYDLMASQFAAYASVIAQMEAGFGGLKQMMAESTAG